MSEKKELAQMIIANIVDEAKKFIAALDESSLKERIIGYVNNTSDDNQFSAYIDIYDAISGEGKRHLFSDKSDISHLIVNDTENDFNLSNMRGKRNMDTLELDLNPEFFSQPRLEIRDLFIGIDQQETTLDKIAARFISEYEYTPTRAYLAAIPMLEEAEQRQSDLINNMVDLEAGEVGGGSVINRLEITLNFEDDAIQEYANKSLEGYLDKINIRPEEINEVLDNERVDLVGGSRPYVLKSGSSLAAKIISTAMRETKSLFHFNEEQLVIIDGLILEIDETYRQKFELSGSNDDYTDYHKNKLRMKVDEATPTINNNNLFMIIKDPDVNEKINDSSLSFEERAKDIYDEWILYGEGEDPEINKAILVYIKHHFNAWKNPHPLYKYMNRKSQCAYITELALSDDNECLEKRGEQIFIDHSMTIAKDVKYSDNDETMNNWIENATDDGEGPIAIQKYGFHGFKDDKENARVSSVYETQGLFKHYDVASILLLHSIDTFVNQEESGNIPAMEIDPIAAIERNAGFEDNPLTKALNNLKAEQLLVKYKNTDSYKIDDDIAKSGVGSIPAARYDLERQYEQSNQPSSTSKKKSKRIDR